MECDKHKMNTTMFHSILF